MKEFVGNKIELTLPEDFYDIAAACRESKYYLDSLEVFATEHVVLPKDYDKELYLGNLTRIKECKGRFEELENEIFFNEKKRLPDGRSQIDFNQIIQVTLAYIELKEDIDELQLDILKHQYNLGYSLINKFTEGREYLKELSTQYIAKYHLYSAFNHSRDENKFDNYRIEFSIEESVTEYSKENVYPIQLKVRNYDYLLKKWREQFKTMKQSEVDLIIGSSRLEEEQKLNKISIEQFKQNQKLNKLNILATIIAIIGLLYGTISTIFLIKDHQVDKLGKDELIIEKLNEVTDNQVKFKDSIINRMEIQEKEKILNEPDTKKKEKK